MNLLLLFGLVLFAGFIFYAYMLFIANTTNTARPVQEKPVEPITDDALERCNTLLEQGLHAELQRFAQRVLAKNYSNIDIRRILAKSFMASGEEQMAIAHYEAILSIAPYEIETQELLAQYYHEKGPRSRAIELYEQILIYDSGNISAVEALAKLYEDAQNYQKAVEMYKMMLEAEVDEQKYNELRYKLGELYIKMDESQEAFEVYEKIHKDEADNLEIIILLADLAYKNKYWIDCLKYYKKIIDIVGDDFEILEKIAQLQVVLEDWEEAIVYYKKIIALEDENSANYLYHQNELCNAMLKNSQFEEAIDLLKDLLIQNPKETSFAFTLAQAYTLVGQYQVGITLYEKLLQDLPTEQSGIIIKYISNLISSWAEDLFAKGQYNQAFDKFFEALKYDEENDDVYYRLGVCNYKIKSFQDSVAHFKRAISIKPQESKYYFGLGCAYDELGSVKSAKIAFFDAININPMDIKARIAYAITLTKELEYAQSIEQFIEVLKYIPDNADTLYNLALAYELVGDVERAIKFYKKAIDCDHEHKEANHNIALLLGEPYIPNTVEEMIDDISTEEENNQTQEEIQEDFMEEFIKEEQERQKQIAMQEEMQQQEETQEEIIEENIQFEDSNIEQQNLDEQFVDEQQNEEVQFENNDANELAEIENPEQNENGDNFGSMFS